MSEDKKKWNQSPNLVISQQQHTTKNHLLLHSFKYSNIIQIMFQSFRTYLTSRCSLLLYQRHLYFVEGGGLTPWQRKQLADSKPSQRNEMALCRIEKLITIRSLLSIWDFIIIFFSPLQDIINWFIRTGVLILVVHSVVTPRVGLLGLNMKSYSLKFPYFTAVQILSQVICPWLWLDSTSSFKQPWTI